MRRGPFALLVTVLVALVAAPGAAADDSALSTRLQELATPELRDAPPAEQADAISLLARGAGSIARVGDSILVEIRVDGHEAARADELAALGADVINVSHDYDTITAAVDESDLRAVARVSGVEYVSEVITPMTGSIDSDGAAGAINTCATGVVSEGNAQLNAGAARTQFDIDGNGVKVGILSDSYDTNTAATRNASQDIVTGDLPGPANSCGRTEPVEVLDDSAVPTPPATNLGDEGRAMLQIVHDIAPGASLAFATAFGGQTVFADNIRALATSGADIIADDVIYFTEPMYQDGIIAKAVNDVTAQGVAYFSMAFNSNGLGINSYEAPNGYRTMACPAAVLALRVGGDDSCMDFDPGAGTDVGFDVTVGAGAPFRLSLSWAEAQFGVNNDFDVYVFNPNTGGAVSLEAETNNLTSQTATEFGSFTVGAAGSRQIVIRRYDGTGTPRLKLVSNDNGAQTWQTTQAVTAPDIQGPTIYGHNGANAAITVGAVPFSNSATMETFSGRGPVVSLFAPVSGTTPAAPLGPLTLVKPDVSATDRGITTFFGSGNRFSGTSAAAPHAAAVGALQLSANPTLSKSELELAQKNTARPVGSFGPNDMGAGLIDAQAAIASVPPPPPSIAITGRPLAPTADTTPTFEFSVTGHPASVTCNIDGAAQPCASPFTPTVPIADGDHTLTVAATDYFGHNAFPAATAFTIDTTGPAAPTISKGPKKKTKSRKATFKFSSEPGATFVCAVDDKLFKPCTSPAKVKVKKAKPKPKKHTFAIEATDALGNAGNVAVYKWKVVKKQPKR